MKKVNIKDVILDDEEIDLMDEIPEAIDWLVGNLLSEGYQADFTLNGLKEIDRFMEEQKEGIIAINPGSILFAIAAYVGQTAIMVYGGEWVVDNDDPDNIEVHLKNDIKIWPGQKVMKKYLNDKENIYTYISSLKNIEEK